MIDQPSPTVAAFRALCFGEKPREPIPVMRLGMPRGWKPELNGPVFMTWEEARKAMGWSEEPAALRKPEPAQIRAMTWEEAEMHEMVADGQL